MTQPCKRAGGMRAALSPRVSSVAVWCQTEPLHPHLRVSCSWSPSTRERKHAPPTGGNRHSAPSVTELPTERGGARWTQASVTALPRHGPEGQCRRPRRWRSRGRALERQPHQGAEACRTPKDGQHTRGGGALRLRRNGRREQQWCRHRLANAGPHRRRGAIRPTGSSAPVPGRPPVVYWPRHCFPDQRLRAVTSARAGAAVHTVSRDVDAHLQLPEVKTPECELKACGRGTCRRRRR